MSALINLSIDVASLPKEKFVTAKNGKVYYNFTVAINNETKFGNNVSAFDSQTKEERDAKKPKTYFGNGKVVWTDGNIVIAERNEEVQLPLQAAAETVDLPF
jgi:hypothetical protein